MKILKILWESVMCMDFIWARCRKTITKSDLIISFYILVKSIPNLNYKKKSCKRGRGCNKICQRNK